MVSVSFVIYWIKYFPLSSIWIFAKTRLTSLFGVVVCSTRQHGHVKTFSPSLNKLICQFFVGCLHSTRPVSHAVFNAHFNIHNEWNICPHSNVFCSPLCIFLNIWNIQFYYIRGVVLLPFLYP